MNCLCPPISFLHENSATVRQHLTPLARLDSQMDKNKRRWGCGEIGTLEYGWRECEVGRCWGGSLGAPQTIRRQVTVQTCSPTPRWTPTQIGNTHPQHKLVCRCS